MRNYVGFCRSGHIFINYHFLYSTTWGWCCGARFTLLLLHSCLHLTRVLNALGSGFESCSYVYLRLVCSRFPYLGSFVLAVASCGMIFCTDAYVYVYQCADGQEKLRTLDTDSICAGELITRIKLLAFATLLLGVYKLY